LRTKRRYIASLPHPRVKRNDLKNFNISEDEELLIGQPQSFTILPTAFPTKPCCGQAADLHVRLEKGKLHTAPEEQEIVLADFSYVLVNCGRIRTDSGVQGC
jgi:hypothetical protein